MLDLLLGLALAAGAEANPLLGCEVQRQGVGLAYRCGDDALTYAEPAGSTDAEARGLALEPLKRAPGALTVEDRPLELEGWKGPATHLTYTDPASPGRVLGEGDLAVARIDAGHARVASCVTKAGAASRCKERLAYLLTRGAPAEPRPVELPPGPHFLGRRLALPDGCRASNIGPGSTSVQCPDGSALQWGAVPPGHDEAATAQLTRQTDYLHKNAKSLREEKVACVIEGASSSCQRIHADGAEIVLAIAHVQGQTVNFMCAYGDGGPVAPVCASILSLAK